MQVLLCVLGYLLSIHGSVACPSDVSGYKEAIANLSCAGELYGHCLKDENERVVLQCLRRSWVQPGFCPVYNIQAKKIDVFLCKESKGKCPDTTFFSNELYKYQSCLKEVSNFKQASTSTLALSTTIINTVTGPTERSIQGSQMTETSSNKRFLFAVIGSVAGIAAVIALIIVVLVRRRTKKGQKKLNNGDEELPLRHSGKTDETDTVLPLSGGDAERENRQKLNIREESSSQRQNSCTVHRPMETKPNNTPPVASRMTDEVVKEILEVSNTVILIIDSEDNIEEIVGKIQNLKYCKTIGKFREWYDANFESENLVFLKGFVVIPYAATMTVDAYKNTFERIRTDIEDYKLHVIIPIRLEAWNAIEADLKEYKLFQNVHEKKIL